MRALVVRGGWEGHQPGRCTELFFDHLTDHGYDLRVADTLAAYADADLMSTVDLVVQCWTRGDLTPEQESGLVNRIRAGAGFAGWHGGVLSLGHGNLDYQYMVGGHFIGHPGGFVDYRVEVRSGHPVVAGLSDFDVHTEQYFCHVDPTLEVLASTTFTGDHGAPETAGAVIPVVWLRRYGAGRVFVSTLGHAPEDLMNPPARTLTERGLLWAGRPA